MLIYFHSKLQIKCFQTLWWQSTFWMRCFRFSSPFSCKCSGFAGTPGYLSPEVLRKEAYGKPVDIWACGESDFGVSLYCSQSLLLPHPHTSLHYRHIRPNNYGELFYLMLFRETLLLSAFTPLKSDDNTNDPLLQCSLYLVCFLCG